MRKLLADTSLQPDAVLAHTFDRPWWTPRIELTDEIRDITLGLTVPGVHANVADLGYGVDGVLGMSFLLDGVILSTKMRRAGRISMLK